MKSIYAYTLIYAVSALTILLLTAAFAAIGYAIGSLAGNTTAGVMCGIAWYCFNIFQGRELLFAQLDAQAEKLIEAL